jgi:hypothetical protein
MFPKVMTHFGGWPLIRSASPTNRLISRSSVLLRSGSVAFFSSKHFVEVIVGHGAWNYPIQSLATCERLVPHRPGELRFHQQSHMASPNSNVSLPHDGIGTYPGTKQRIGFSLGKSATGPDRLWPLKAKISTAWGRNSLPWLRV